MITLPSPDGVYIAILGPKTLEILNTISHNLQLSLNLRAACSYLCWDASGAQSEYRLVLASKSHLIAIGFTQTTSYYIVTPALGAVASVQWTTMYSDRGQLIPRLASICETPDIASIECNGVTTGKIFRPKSYFIPVELSRGWAILHSRGTNDRVTFFSSGRVLGTVALLGGIHNCIAGAIDSPLVAVAYASVLYLVCPNRVIAMAQNLAVTQMAWMACGSLIAISAEGKVMKLTKSLLLNSIISPNCCRVHVLAEKQVFEVTSKMLNFSKPRLLTAVTGNYCAIQCISGGFVYVIDCFGGSELFDYRGDITVLEWQGDNLCFKFELYGVVWSKSQGFKIIDHSWQGSDFMATDNGYLAWTQTGEYKLMAAQRLQSGPGPELQHSNGSFSHNEENLDNNFSLESNPISPFRSPLRATVLNADKDDSSFLHLPSLNIPSVLLSFQANAEEDTFHYKRLD